MHIKLGLKTQPEYYLFCTPTARSRTVTLLRLRHQVIALQSDNENRSVVNEKKSLFYSKERRNSS